MHLIANVEEKAHSLVHKVQFFASNQLVFFYLHFELISYFVQMRNSTKEIQLRYSRATKLTNFFHKIGLVLI